MIRRSKTDSIIGGVCGGLAEKTDTNAWAWRLIFLLVPSSIWLYIALWILFKLED